MHSLNEKNFKMGENENLVLKEIQKEAQEASQNLISKKSKEVYDREYSEFNLWKEKRGVHIINEDVLLAYFFNARKKCAPSHCGKNIQC